MDSTDVKQDIVEQLSALGTVVNEQMTNAYLFGGSVDIDRVLALELISRDFLAENLSREVQFPNFGEGKLMLDLGCGPGGLTKVLWEMYSHAKIIGVEIDPVVHAKAESLLTEIKAKTASFNTDATFVLGNILTDLRRIVGDRPVDFIYLRLVLIHLPEAMKNALMQELYSLLAPGGYLWIADGNLVTLAKTFGNKFINRPIVEKYLGYSIEAIRKANANPAMYDEVPTLLEKHNFILRRTIQEKTYIDGTFYGKLWRLQITQGAWRSKAKIALALSGGDPVKQAEIEKEIEKDYEAVQQVFIQSPNLSVPNNLYNFIAVKPS